MPWLEWIHRDKIVRVADGTPYHLLEADQELGYGVESGENLLIHGDNLLALKALLPYFAGQVKCIYADPPFNTGQAFEDFDDNLEHSIWLSMMYPSLVIQRDLLAEDGTIFFHIDDNELGYLIGIADEVFGRSNRCAIVTFKQGAPTGHKAINPGMVNTTNFILVYAKNKSRWRPNRISTGRERDKRYTKFLVNPEASHEKWEFVSLAKAISQVNGGKTITEIKKEYGPAYEEYVNKFVLSHSDQVAQFVRPDYGAVSADARALIDRSKARPGEILRLQREQHSDMFFLSGQRIIFYRGKLRKVDGEMVAGEPLTTLWDDLLSNNLHKEGDVTLPKSKKPEALVKRIIELATSSNNDVVLDAYLGSGTTAAVAHKMGRRWIGIERGEHALTKCLPRLRAVVDGEGSGVSSAVGWTGGGGFRFFRVGPRIFDERGNVSESVEYGHLAAHVWFCEIGSPLGSLGVTGPLLGVHEGTAIYLLYNGVLGDRRVDGGNVLTRSLLSRLPRHDGPKVVYGEATRLSTDRLTEMGIVFKQTPYDIRAR
jgi:adenine-specific DNA-methyltransferase